MYEKDDIEHNKHRRNLQENKTLGLLCVWTESASNRTYKMMEPAYALRIIGMEQVEGKELLIDNLSYGEGEVCYKANTQSIGRFRYAIFTSDYRPTCA